MTQEDIIERVITENGQFFGVACNSTALVGEGCHRHDAGPLAAMALGRAMTGAALLAALMKDGQSLLLKFEGGGILKKVSAEAGYDGWVRGFVAEPHADLPLIAGKIDVAGGICGRDNSGAIGVGVLTVQKNITAHAQYPGIIPLQNGEIGEDISWYLTQSEQTPSTVGVTTTFSSTGEITAAGGFLIQSLPPADQQEITVLEKNIASLPSLSALLTEGNAPQEILSRIFGKIPHHLIHQKPLCYQCHCSQEKMENALITLGKADLLKLAQEREECEVCCEFCRQQYIFSASQIYGLAQLLPS